MDGKSYLKTLDKFGVKPGLERIELLLDYLGHPEKRLNIIHIGGTNGKGSTSALLTAIYKEAGYKIGTYNSPHIVDFNERIRINGQNISDRQLNRLVEAMKLAVGQVRRKLEPPSFFEVVTALALMYFAQQEVELAILEVGMGGRWDATNIGQSLASVITNVSLDHTDFLGETVEEIAREKAGIIDSDQPVITGINKEPALNELQQEATEKQSELINVQQRFSWQQKEVSLQGQNLNIVSPVKDYNDLWLPLLGKYQIANLLLAVAVTEELREKYPLTCGHIKRGIADVSWPGRLEVVAKNPIILLDGAHNQAAASNLNQFLTQLEYQNLILGLGILADKDISGIGNQLAAQAEQVIITQNKNHRAAKGEKLARKLRIKREEIRLISEVSAAVKIARELAEAQDLILITGSLYTVREARQILT